MTTLFAYRESPNSVHAAPQEGLAPTDAINPMLPLDPTEPNIGDWATCANGTCTSSLLWVRAPGALYDASGQPQSDDPVMDNHLWDCEFISAMSAFAKYQPQVITHAIHDNGDGTYTVTLYAQRDPQSQPYGVPITVTDEMPMRNGQLALGRARNPQVLWPAVIEKAYAKFKGGYQYIWTEWATGTISIEALSGQNSSAVQIFHHSDPNQVFGMIQDALRGQQVVLGATYFGGVTNTTGFDEPNPINTVATDATDPVPASPAPFPMINYNGSIAAGGHSYSILDTSVDASGQRWIQVRNPFAYAEDGGYANTVVGPPFNVKLEEFITYWNELDIGSR